MTRSLRDFVPLTENVVNMYVCGPTVYNYIHIGNARSTVAFDTIRRYFEYRGYTVNYISNFTDVDDKIIKAANEAGISTKELSDKFIAAFMEDTGQLGIKPATQNPRVINYMDEIIAFVSILIDKGFAYETEDGVYFGIDNFEEFGKLSNRNIEELESHREIAKTTKKNPIDFALWKKRENVDEPVWNSPWGEGRPGWHIEDTAITEYYFGPQYDVHGGGLDLIFPHHEAEITQMEAVSGKSPMVCYWLHTGFLNVSGEKMSKSLNNFITIRELLKEYDADVFRFFVLSTHYRSPIDFSKESLHQSEKSLDKIKKYYKKQAFHPSADTAIVKATLLNDAGIYGAAKLAL